jgi:hypothetical protein
MVLSTHNQADQECFIFFSSKFIYQEKIYYQVVKSIT